MSWSLSAARHRIIARFPNEWQDEQLRECETARFSKPRKPDGHTSVSFGQLIPVSAKQPVPLGEIETIVAVRLPYDHGMMYPVHVRCDHKESHCSVELQGQSDIAMIKHARSIQNHFGYEYLWSAGQAEPLLPTLYPWRGLSQYDGIVIQW